MSTVTAPSATPHLVPPEERFWQRYSPHSEAPVSGVTSTVIHILILLLILGVAWVQSFINPESKLVPPPVVVVKFDEGVPGAAGPGKDGEPGAGAPGDDQPAPAVGGLPLPGNHDDLKPAQPSKPDSMKDRPIGPPRSSGSGPLSELDKLIRDAEKKLGKSIQPGPGGGIKDKGPASGGEGAVKRTMERLDRWTLVLNTRSERDYLNQLIGLGGSIAIPVDGKNRYFVISDLNNPKSGKEKDLSDHNSIFWIDSKPDSLSSFFSALDRRRPAYFVVLFPRDLEVKMRQLEEKYTREHFNYSGEADIKETRFVVVSGNEIRVDHAEMKKRR